MKKSSRNVFHLLAYCMSEFADELYAMMLSMLEGGVKSPPMPFDAFVEDLAWSGCLLY